MSSYEKILEGYKKFRGQYLSEENFLWRYWAQEGQSPKVMIIACSDSRVNPVIITNARLGELFIVNNVANLVPPYKKEKHAHHSTSAAIEYAVTQLKVQHIIIMGHSGCGGIRALMAEHEEPHPDQPYSFIRPWMEIVDEAAEFSAEEKTTLDGEALACLCERRAILISLNNLLGFPWVEEAIAKGDLQAHAWHFDIGSGILQEYDRETDQFQELV